MSTTSLHQVLACDELNSICSNLPFPIVFVLIATAIANPLQKENEQNLALSLANERAGNYPEFPPFENPPTTQSPGDRKPIWEGKPSPYN